MAVPAKRAREEGGGAVASKRREHRGDDSPTDAFKWRCLACNEVFAKHAHWVKHVERSPFCEDAKCERFDPRQEKFAKMCAAAGESSYASDVQQHLVGTYATLQYEKLVPRTCIQSVVKEQLVEPLAAKMKDEVLRRLASNPEERRTLEQQIRTVFEVHAGIETSAMEEGVLRRTVNPVAPCKRELIDRPDAQRVLHRALGATTLCTTCP